MGIATIIEEPRPPDQNQVIRDFVLAGKPEIERLKVRRSLGETLPQSPFAGLDFEWPERVRSPIRPAEL